MPKLQDLLDRNESQMAERTAQQPGEDVLERQRRFHQKETRLQELRQSRLTATDKPPELRTYDVVRHNGAWRVLHLGRYSTGHNDQQAAIVAAIEKAKGQMARGRTAQVRLNRTDGQVWLADLETGTVSPPAHRSGAGAS
ncbi:MAG TPA: hypothetical protein VJV39_07100 [Dongiaceae bacterium]|nr:hypothetical protein [Dongiaceae bacterium]